jgi:hypothetical protein
MSDPISIPEAAAKYGVDVRRLRGRIWQENMTGELSAPIGSVAEDVVYDDDRLKACVRELAGSVAG